MKLEDQVCTLEQAKILRELGIIQVSLFDWCVFMPDPTGEKYYYSVVYKETDVDDQLHEWIASAFTIAELGALLDHIPVKTYQELHTNRKGFYVETKLGEKEYFEHEAHARGRMLILRLEKGWDTAETINTRFT
jgi:hypothetical protein